MKNKTRLNSSQLVANTLLSQILMRVIGTLSRTFNSFLMELKSTEGIRLWARASISSRFVRMERSAFGMPGRSLFKRLRRGSDQERKMFGGHLFLLSSSPAWTAPASLVSPAYYLIQNRQLPPFMPGPMKEISFSSIGPSKKRQRPVLVVNRPKRKMRASLSSYMSPSATTVQCWLSNALLSTLTCS